MTDHDFEDRIREDYFNSFGYQLETASFIEGILNLAPSGVHFIQVASGYGQGGFGFTKEDDDQIHAENTPDDFCMLLEKTYGSIYTQETSEAIILLSSMPHSGVQGEDNMTMSFWMAHKGSITPCDTELAKSLASTQMDAPLIEEMGMKFLDAWEPGDIFRAAGLGFSEKPKELDDAVGVKE